MLAEPGYGEDIRCHGFVPYASAPVKPLAVGSAPSSPLKMTEQRWVFPPNVQRSLEKALYSGDNASPRLGMFLMVSAEVEGVVFFFLGTLVYGSIFPAKDYSKWGEITKLSFVTVS